MNVEEDEIRITRQEILNINEQIRISNMNIDNFQTQLSNLNQKLDEAIQNRDERNINFFQSRIMALDSQLVAERNNLAASKNLLTELYRRLPSSPGKILVFLIFSQIFIQSKSMCFSISYLFVSIDTKAVAVVQVLFTYFL